MARQSDDRSVVSMLWRLFSRHYDESRVLSVGGNLPVNENLAFLSQFVITWKHDANHALVDTLARE